MDEWLVMRNAMIVMAGVTAGFAIFFLLNQNALMATGALILLCVLGLILRWPEAGTFVVLFAIYSNIGVLAMRPQRAVLAAAGTPDENPRIAVVLAAMSLLLAVPLVHQLLIRKEKLVFDRGFTLMLAFFAVLLASSLFARDAQLAAARIADYFVEGVAIYFVITNIVRDIPTLRQATWSLLLAGILMAGLTVYQRATHTEDRIYGGLAQMDVDVTLKAKAKERSPQPAVSIAGKNASESELRAAGPIGETNRYAQILLVLLPFAGVVFRTEHSRLLRMLGLVGAAVILGGLLLTFSRSSFLAGLVVLGLTAWLRLLKPRHVVVSALGVGFLVVAFAPGVIARMASLQEMKGLLFHTGYTYKAPDSSALYRYTLNVATWHVFLDHPLLGVGPGHFAEYYSIPYANRVGLIETTRKFMGHNFYLETLAETGVAGLACLLGILAAIMQQLWKERRRWAQSNPEFSHWATGFFLCLCAYAITAVFAHLSYQRYFWLLVALSSAAARIIHSQREAQGMAESFSFQGGSL